MSSDERCGYLILNNIAKRGNFGTLLRSAAAFGIREVFVVGARKLQTFGNQGTTRYLRISHFDSLEKLRPVLAARGVRVCGVEITPEARDVATLPFNGPTAFMFGSEGDGMNEKQLAFCDHFVYVPQYSGCTASLNVAVAGGIVLQYFARWAGLAEQPRDAMKFRVETPLTPLEKWQQAGPEELAAAEALRLQRKRKREEAADDDQ